MFVMQIGGMLQMPNCITVHRLKMESDPLCFRKCVSASVFRE